MDEPFNSSPHFTIRRHHWKRADQALGFPAAWRDNPIIALSPTDCNDD
jgi:hypothetical protein